MKGKIFNKNLMKFSLFHLEEKSQKIKIFTCLLHSSIIFICVTINSLTTIWNRSEVNFEFDNDSPVECAFLIDLTLHLTVETVTNCTRTRDAHRNWSPSARVFGIPRNWNWRKRNTTAVDNSGSWLLSEFAGQP